MHAGVPERHVVEGDALALDGALADQAFADRDGLGLARARGIAGEPPEDGVLLVDGVHLVDRALLGIDQRGQLGEQHLADGEKITLPLKHAGELRQVGLQPVLLLVGLRS